MQLKRVTHFDSYWYKPAIQQAVETHSEATRRLEEETASRLPKNASPQEVFETLNSIEALVNNNMSLPTSSEVTNLLEEATSSEVTSLFTIVEYGDYGPEIWILIPYDR